MNRIPWALLFTASACETESKTPGPVDDTDPPLEYSLFASGSAPWDPIQTMCDREVVEPLVLGPSGETVPMVALQSQGETYAWAPEADLSAGTYTVTGVLGDDRGLDTSWDVGSHGLDPDFSKEAVVGAIYAFQPDTLWVAAPPVAEALVGDLFESYDLYLQILAVEAESATFRLIAVVRADSTACQVFAGEGSLSETGQLWWASDALEIETDGGTMHTEDLALHLGWLADASSAAGAEGRATVDTRVLSGLLLESENPEEMCNFIAGAGLFGTCYDCIGDGLLTCLDIRVHAGTLLPVALDLDEELPLCGIDLGEGLPTYACDVPDFDLELDCGCQTARGRAGALWLSLGLLSVLRARRRPACEYPRAGSNR